ncbi:Cobalt-precorrin-5B (C1)-methyltransferase [hydrothermal vent metagenome]|uniref:Cobalt-precorrin-5B (C1)-methyltransferase n=1 Tax=hydrothermal vent metagenome TaxID=652676 RepID=A0A3B1CHZ2_9ZZZZ
MRKKHRFEVTQCEFTGASAKCVVIKDAGDDPDCTNGAHLTATVSWQSPVGDIQLKGGAGVATVTKAGLGLVVGSAAINPVPFKNITDMVREGAGEALKTKGLEVIISVPNGEKMSELTQNARLGLVGGISILGTSGIVRPYSSAAYKVSIAQGMDVARGEGLETLVLTTGGKSESYLMRHTALPASAYVQMGDFAGFSLKRAAKRGFKKVIIGGMPGKLSKIARGKMQTHVAGSQVNLAFLAELAREAGAPHEIVQLIAGANTARHVQEIVAEHQIQGFWDIVARKVCAVCRKEVRDVLIVVCLLVDFGGTVIGKAQIGEGEH